MANLYISVAHFCDEKLIFYSFVIFRKDIRYTRNQNICNPFVRYIILFESKISCSFYFALNIVIKAVFMSYSCLFQNKSLYKWSQLSVMMLNSNISRGSRLKDQHSFDRQIKMRKVFMLWYKLRQKYVTD
jgi:hypothetical protein